MAHARRRRLLRPPAADPKPLHAVRSGLGDLYHRYRTPSPADVRWLRDRVADPSTGVQGIAFCLELLYAHGEATRAELEALLPRWKKELTKQYRTTYTEWRHPLVTLTCLALDLHHHPAAADLLSWWAKPKPLWHYAVDPRSHSWLRRAQEVADDPRLTDAARAIGLRTAREHYAFGYPDQVRPALTDGQVAAAHAWAEDRADRTTGD